MLDIYIYPKAGKYEVQFLPFNSYPNFSAMLYVTVTGKSFFKTQLALSATCSETMWNDVDWLRLTGLDQCFPGGMESLQPGWQDMKHDETDTVKICGLEIERMESV